MHAYSEVSMQLLLTLVWHFQSLRGLLPGGSGSHPPGRPPLSDRDEPHSSPYDEGSPVSCKGGGGGYHKNY